MLFADKATSLGTVVAASVVAKAPADGYTLLLGSNTTLTMNPAIRTNLPYDPLKSFTPLALVADMGLLLVAHNDTPGQSLKDIVAHAKAAPDKFSYGSYGTGSSVHFGAEMLKTTAGFPMMHVPFNGSSPSLTALMGGHLHRGGVHAAHQVRQDQSDCRTQPAAPGPAAQCAHGGRERLPRL